MKQYNDKYSDSYLNILKNKDNAFLNIKKGLTLDQISNYGIQILSALNYLHNNNTYHLNLHSGNVLIDNNNCTNIKITDFENIYLGLNFRKELYYLYIFKKYIIENKQNSYDYYKNSNILYDIFSPKANIFEIIDIVSFGRIMYEMYTGKELNAPYPDEIELFEFENSDFKDLINEIFPRNIDNLGNSFVDIPRVNAIELSKFPLFKNYKHVLKTFDHNIKKSKNNSFSNFQESNLLSKSDLNKLDSESYNTHSEESKDAKINLYNMGLEFNTYDEVKEKTFDNLYFINLMLNKIKNM